MIAAAGNQVQVVDKDGAYVAVTGNSFAAPAVAGAAALLKQYWPLLGGRAIARILLDTATDAGAPGVDQVFGVGILDVEKAMQAQAPASSFVRAEAVLARWSSLSVPPAFGGAATAAALNARLGSLTVLDRYGRDYRMTGAAGVRARGAGLLSGVLPFHDWRALRQASPADRRLGFTDAPVGPWQGPSGLPVSAFVPLGGGRSLAVAASAAVGAPASAAGSFLRSVVAQPVGASASFTAAGWSLSAGSGASRDRRASVRSFSLATPLGMGLEIASLAEGGRVLGLDGGIGLSLGGARTTLATLSGNRAVGAFLLSARATVGSTRATGSDTLRFAGDVISSAFAVEGGRGLLGGFATLGLSSPLRVERARADLLVPATYDLITGALVQERRSVDLSPAARELDAELGWLRALSPTSSLRFGIVRAFDAGNVAGARDVADFLSWVVR